MNNNQLVDQEQHAQQSIPLGPWISHTVAHILWPVSHWDHTPGQLSCAHGHNEVEEGAQSCWQLLPEGVAVQSMKSPCGKGSGRYRLSRRSSQSQTVEVRLALF